MNVGRTNEQEENTEKKEHRDKYDDSTKNEDKEEELYESGLFNEEYYEGFVFVQGEVECNPQERMGFHLTGSL